MIAPKRLIYADVPIAPANPVPNGIQKIVAPKNCANEGPFKRCPRVLLQPGCIAQSHGLLKLKFTGDAFKQTRSARCSATSRGSSEGRGRYPVRSKRQKLRGESRESTEWGRSKRG